MNVIATVRMVRRAQAGSEIEDATASAGALKFGPNTAPDANPITNFHVGLLFCVDTGHSGIALIRQTAPLGSSNILHLQETYWPNSG